MMMAAQMTLPRLPVWLVPLSSDMRRKRVKGTKRATARVGLMPGRAPIISPTITPITRITRFPKLKA